MSLTVNIKKLNKDAIIPKYESVGAAGMDIIPTSVEYNENIDCWVYHTGLSFQLPENHVLLIFPRSSNRKTNAYLPNSVGILDSDYRGELLVCYKNRDTADKKAPYEINGKGIAQIIIVPYPKVVFKEVETLSATERGEGGFGSTDVK